MFALRPLTIKRGINLKNKDIGAALLAAIPAFFPDYFEGGAVVFSLLRIAPFFSGDLFAV